MCGSSVLLSGASLSAAAASSGQDSVLWRREGCQEVPDHVESGCWIIGFNMVCCAGYDFETADAIGDLGDDLLGEADRDERVVLARDDQGGAADVPQCRAQI